jgi:hypothetical protein
MMPRPTPLTAVMDMLGLTGPSWAPWRVVGKLLDGAALDATERRLYETCTGRDRLPSEPPREALLVAGRRSGKSRFGSAVAVHAAAFTSYPMLAPGEKVTVAAMAADRAQAETIFHYTAAPFVGSGELTGLVQRRSAAREALRRLVSRQTRTELELTSGVTVAVHTAHYVKIRGRTLGLALGDECALGRDERTGANPATEILNAIRPALATTRGRLLLPTTPFAKLGAVWDLFSRYWGVNDAPTLVWHASSLTMNPTLDPRVVEAALDRDETVARREWMAQFAESEAGYTTRGVLARCVVRGRSVLEPQRGADYLLFLDAASGSGADAMAWAVTHLEEDERGCVVVVVDRVEAMEPPFDPAAAARAVAGVGRGYGVYEAHGDRCALGWLAAMLQREGLRYTPSPMSRSELYVSLLPLLNAGLVELPDDVRLLDQLAGLERRLANGREAIDHGAGRHDDLANCLAGAAVLAYREARAPGQLVW